MQGQKMAKGDSQNIQHLNIPNYISVLAIHCIWTFIKGIAKKINLTYCYQILHIGKNFWGDQMNRIWAPVLYLYLFSEVSHSQEVRVNWFVSVCLNIVWIFRGKSGCLETFSGDVWRNCPINLFGFTKTYKSPKPA